MGEASECGGSQVDTALDVGRGRPNSALSPRGQGRGNRRVGQIAGLDLATLVGYPFSSPQRNQAEFHVILKALRRKDRPGRKSSCRIQPLG